MRIEPFETWPVQNAGLQALHERMEQGKTPHAMLFIGPTRETEIFTEYLGRVLLCRDEAAPCGVCEGCLQMKAGNHPDYAIVDVEGTVKTAQIEAIQEQLTLRAHAGGRTVYVLRGIDNITPVAANRLLKTLEEPVPSVIALLTAQNQQRILPTIVSRCFIYRLNETTAEMSWDDPFPLLITSGESEGENGLFETVSKPMVQWAQKLLTNTEYPFVLADSFTKLSTDIELSDMLHILSVWFRDVMHFQAGDKQHIRFVDFEADLGQQSKLATIQQLVSVIQIVVQARSRLRSHVAAQLNTEQMCIRLREVLRCV
jgi:DNA polymerase-3 subunit delta'